LGLSISADRYARNSGGEVTVHRLSDDSLLCRIPRDSTVRPDGIGPGISADGRFVSVDTMYGVRIWRCEEERSALVGHWPGATHVAFTPDSKQAVVSHPVDGVQLIDLATGLPVKQLLQRDATARPAFHRASKRIAICTNAGVSIIDWPTGQAVVELPEETKDGCGVAWHPSGEVVAICGPTDGVELWNVASRRLLTRFPHRAVITRPYFSQDGSLLLTQGDWTGELRVWDTGTGQAMLHSGFTAAFAADDSGCPGDFLAKLQSDKLTLCRIVPGVAANPLLDAPHNSIGDVSNIAVSPDGRLLAIGRSRGFELWDLASGRRTSHTRSPNCGAAFTPSGDLLIACRWGLYRWPLQVTASGDDRQQGRRGYRFGPPESLSGPLGDVEISISRDGNLVAVNASTGWQIHRLGDSNQVTRLPWKKDIRGISVSPDGKSVSLANWRDAGVEVWSTSNVRRIVDLPAGRNGRPLFSPNGRWLAATPDGVRLWHVADWRPGPKVHSRGDTPSGLGIAFSPDSKVLAVSQPDEITRLVDPETGIDWAELRRPDALPSPFLAFTPDQSRLIEAPWGRGTPRIWDLTAIRRQLARLGLDWPADVLKVEAHKPIPSSSNDAAITLDEGNMANVQAAADLIMKAGIAKDDEARKSLEQAIHLDPESVHAHNNLAWLLVAGPESLRNAKEAVRLARRAVQLDGTLAPSWNTLGVALYRDGQHSEAIAALNRSLERGGDIEAGHNLVFLALCHFHMGNTTVADDYCQRALNWYEQHRSRLSQHSRNEINTFLAEAKAVGLPKRAPTN
jgi:WD40 repeat protein